MENRNETTFLHKQTLLITAIEKVKKALTKFEIEAAKIPNGQMWGELENEKFKNWNNYYDLQYRLENRIRENFRNYQHWHFEKFGWRAFD